MKCNENISEKERQSNHCFGEKWRIAISNKVEEHSHIIILMYKIKLKCLFVKLSYQVVKTVFNKTGSAGMVYEDRRGKACKDLMNLSKNQFENL